MLDNIFINQEIWGIIRFARLAVAKKTKTVLTEFLDYDFSQICIFCMFKKLALYFISDVTARFKEISEQ